MCETSSCEQVGDAGRFERPADHGRDAEHGALIGRESVEPGGKQGVHRGRQRDTAEIADQRPCGAVAAEQSFVDHHREQLLDEQRVALGRRRDPLLRVVIERRMVDEVLDQPVDIGSCEWSKRQGRGTRAPAPTLSSLIDVGTCGAYDEQGRVAHPVHQAVQQVQERGLRPVHVFDQQDGRRVAGELFQKSADRPERLALGELRVPDAEDVGEPIDDAGAVVRVRQERQERSASGLRRPRRRRCRPRPAPPPRSANR